MLLNTAQISCGVSIVLCEMRHLSIKVYHLNTYFVGVCATTRSRRGLLSELRRYRWSPVVHVAYSVHVLALDRGDVIHVAECEAKQHD